MVARAVPVVRGCGPARQAGGIYAECGLSPHGRPLEEFLLDPPLRLDLEVQRALGLRPIGVTLAPDPLREGVHHVFDWVGTAFYPNVADFLEEVRRYGLSRRLPRSLDFARLSPESRHVLVHANAWIDDPAPYLADRVEAAGGLMWCPRALPEHLDRGRPPAMCAGLWWEDVDGGVAVPERGGRRAVERAMPAFGYPAEAPPPFPPGYARRYTPALFASFPISRLVAITDPEGGAHEAAAARARAARGIPVELEDA
jgi:hypothetical protein